MTKLSLTWRHLIANKKKSKITTGVTHMPGKYLPVRSQQKRRRKTRRICLKNKTSERHNSELRNSIPFCFVLPILHILEGGEINKGMGRKWAIFFRGIAKCIKIIFDLDSLYVEIFDEIWKVVGLVLSPNLT